MSAWILAWSPSAYLSDCVGDVRSVLLALNPAAAIRVIHCCWCGEAPELRVVTLIRRSQSGKRGHYRISHVPLWHEQAFEEKKPLRSNRISQTCICVQTPQKKNRDGENSEQQANRTQPALTGGQHLLGPRAPNSRLHHHLLPFSNHTAAPPVYPRRNSRPHPLGRAIGPPDRPGLGHNPLRSIRLRPLAAQLLLPQPLTTPPLHQTLRPRPPGVGRVPLAPTDISVGVAMHCDRS